ncbi:hypothetical protein HYU19_04080 [Candidatus Woesearchaeota archaeon]|nr:hypothetical protein [Candidatus Woesearchaeota archaeon]
MIDYKIAFGYIAIFLALISYAHYIRAVLADKTKPHAFSWLVWSVLGGIAFAAQIVKQGGAGAWVTGVTTVLCFIIFLLALWKGVKDFPIIDWICIALAGVSLWIWWLMKDPTISVIMVIITDTLAYVPTFRKSYHNPFEETATIYAVYFFIWILSLSALNSYSIATWLYPAWGIADNAAMVSMLVWRRRAQQ